MGIVGTIKNKIKLLKRSYLFPNIDINICNMVNKLKFNEINKKSKPKIILVNSDKLISLSKIKDKYHKINKIKWDNIGFLIFDEVHHIGANKTFEIMNYIKENNYVNFCIGSS